MVPWPSQRHSDSKHTDDTVHGAVLPSHCAASWKRDRTITQPLFFLWRLEKKPAHHQWSCPSSKSWLCGDQRRFSAWWCSSLRNITGKFGTHSGNVCIQLRHPRDGECKEIHQCIWMAVRVSPGEPVNVPRCWLSTGWLCSGCNPALQSHLRCTEAKPNTSRVTFTAMVHQRR